jgi:hypothetical protein
MDKQTFFNLDIDKQIAFFNNELSKSKSFTKISKELGISKSISEKFKKHGYTIIDGLFQLEKKLNQEATELNQIKRSSRTIVIDTDLWKQLKIYSVVHDITISEILEKQAKDFLKKNQL